MAGAAASATVRAPKKRRRAGAARRAVRQAPSSPVSVGGVVRKLRGWKHPRGGRFPCQEHLPAALHAGAVLTGDFDLHNLLADSDVELEGVAVIADVLDPASESVVPVASFPGRGDQHVLGPDQNDD